MPSEGKMIVGFFYRNFFRPLLFLFDSERVHEFVVAMAQRTWRFGIGRTMTRGLFCRKNPQNHSVTITTDHATLLFRNPVGLAAGFDKNALLLPGIENLGFGFVEIGTVTPRPQTGNAKPRLFREPSQRALVNRMGFNNEGAAAISARLRAVKPLCTIPIGVNLGKNKDTPNENAVDDYEKGVHAFRDLADYFTINLSSPNTPGLRELQNREFLGEFEKRVDRAGTRSPFFIKLAPEISEESLADLCGFVNASKFFTGMILTNTIATDIGGLSGAPLKQRSFEVLESARKKLQKNRAIISVGGIETAEDVRRRLAAGATAVQIYTALIYEGPSVISKILCPR